MPLPDLLPIVPFTRPARGEVTLPGSKSITNRALLLAALCDGPVTLTGALFSEDTEIMAKALDRLGFKIEMRPEKKEIYVEGRAGEIPAKAATLHVGLAGTAARFLTALCAAAKSGTYRLDGVPQMRKRPMKGLIDALRSRGADIRCTGEEGFFPLEIHACGLRGGLIEIDASESSQMLSALHMVAPYAEKVMEIKHSKPVRQPFVYMTLEMMARFGLATGHNVATNTYSSPNMPYHYSGNFSIEPDASAASYFFALPLVNGGGIYFPGMSGAGWGIQGDTKFISVLEQVGVNVSQHQGTHNEYLPSLTPIYGIDVAYYRPAPRHGVTQDFSKFSDTFLTLAAIAPLLDEPTTITGIAHTRKQETDRVAGAARELRKLGQDVHEHEDGDGLTITPNLAALRQLAAAAAAEGRQIEIDTYGDHRFAMSFAILGCYDLLGTGAPWLAIKNPACCAKTFPNFFDVLATLRANSHSDSVSSPSSA